MTPLTLSDVLPDDRGAALEAWLNSGEQRLLLNGMTMTQADLDVVASALDRVSFNEVAFVGPISFQNVIAPDLGLRFVNSTFSGRVDVANIDLQPRSILKFSSCEFHQVVSFAKATFEARKLHFAGTNFHDDVDLTGFGMANHTRFERSAFHARVRMDGARFGSELTQFLDCQFDGPVELMDTLLPTEARVQFQQCVFSEQVALNAAQGSGSVEIEECEPSGVLDGLATAGGPGAYDPPRDGLEFRFLDGTHKFWIANERALLWLLQSLGSVPVMVGQAGDAFGFEIFVSRTNEQLELRESAESGGVRVEPGSEYTALHSALSYRAAPTNATQL